jgi:hypothetical protein
VDTMNIGSRALTCPPFNIALRERRLTGIQVKRPRSRRGLNWFPNPGDLSKRKRDHIPNNLLFHEIWPCHCLALKARIQFVFSAAFLLAVHCCLSDENSI